jgi:hypothetical protein
VADLKHKRIHVELYGCYVHFYTTREAWVRAMVRGTDWTRDRAVESAAGSGATNWSVGVTHCYVGVFDGNAGTIAHEMVHAAAAILDAAGVRFTHGNNETLAYLVGLLVDKVTKGTK